MLSWYSRKISCFRQEPTGYKFVPQVSLDLFQARYPPEGLFDKGSQIGSEKITLSYLLGALLSKAPLSSKNLNIFKETKLGPDDNSNDTKMKIAWPLLTDRQVVTGGGRRHLFTDGIMSLRAFLQETMSTGCGRLGATQDVWYKPRQSVIGTYKSAIRTYKSAMRIY